LLVIQEDPITLLFKEITATFSLFHNFSIECSNIALLFAETIPQISPSTCSDLCGMVHVRDSTSFKKLSEGYFSF
jgi:hypothetical protein